MKSFLEKSSIDFYTKVEGDATPYLIRTKNKHCKKEKAILPGLQESIVFVYKHKKGKVKAKSFNQLLMA